MGPAEPRRFRHTRAHTHGTVWSCLGLRPPGGSDLQTQPGALSDLSSAFSSLLPFSLEHLSAFDLSLTRSLTPHSLTRSLTHSLTHSFNNSCRVCSRQ